jgi:alkylation response protein AidB-like acyl-CoA dehydrogenase
MAEAQPGRDALAKWLAARSDNYYDAAPHLRAALLHRVGAERVAAMEPALRDFGAAVATRVDPAVEVLERHPDLPALHSYDAIGRHVESIEFHPAHREAGEAVWGAGMVSINRGGHGHFEQAAHFYLLSHVGEGGQACPVVCTAGLARAIERRGSADLQARFLPGLFAAEYRTALRASQFLTEVQGGSDVGANVAHAERDPDTPGAWRITAEKWFCSVADADLFAITARPDGGPSGTRGLGCFVVPRTLDGTRPNGFRIRRLKDKLGTRCLASGEFDFEGALAWPLGAVEDGFHIAVEELLNTSRWLNALGSTGIMRRAYLEASSFAAHRTAFGSPIGAFPIVREQLAAMKIEERGALASTLALTALIERVDAGVAGDEELAAHRLLGNANKFVTSIAATDVAHRGIELLGGNGTIEDFSVLPRLYRDAVVFESWEGTHNVLCEQVRRDCVRLGILDGFVAWLIGELERTQPGASKDGIGAAIKRAEAGMHAAGSTPAGASRFRRELELLVRATQAACLHAEACASDDPATHAAVRLFVHRHLAETLGDGLVLGDVDLVLGDDIEPG